MTNPTAKAGPSAADIKDNPGLAPENHVRGENLYKASTDRTEADLIENSGARDLWVIEADAIFVRADDEEAAKTKFLSALGVAFDTREVKVRNATPKDLGT